MSIDIENQYEPEYQITEEKHKLVAELKKAVKDADVVWLASDEDREGEAIAWHLQETLKLNPEKTKRIVFNEITKNAILHAIENPRGIDMNLVDAQQARRVLDRLVGYEISPILWAKIKPALSAGRVQSVAVRLIVEREEEIKNFVSQNYFKVTAQFHPANGRMQVIAELSRRFDTEQEAGEFINSLSRSEILDIVYRQPSPNKFFASLTPFALNNGRNAFINTLLGDCLDDFFENQICLYDTELKDLYMVGSVASILEKELRECAAKHGFVLRKTLQKPIEGLAEYHCRRW